MSTNTLRPGLTAAMAAGRALLAAGWRYDSTSPMADDTTIRTLLHPTGREIHARTVDGGEQTDLTMTGLSLEQVAGAIDGAGLAPAEDAIVIPAAAVDAMAERVAAVTAETSGPAGADPRQIAWQLVTDGVAAGLPIPVTVDIPTGHNIFEVKVADDDTAAADAWAAHLGLPQPSYGGVIRASRDFRNYSADTWEHPSMPEWQVKVSCYVDEPAGSTS